EIVDKFITEGYSRMPVYKDSIDNIIGLIYAKDLINIMKQNKISSVNDILRPAYFVHEDQKINVLLHDMQKRRIHVAIVLDEFGGTAGLVTLEDIIEEIFGEIQDEYDEELPLIEKLNDTEFNIKASATIDDTNDVLPIPLPESDDYETVGGLLTSVTGRIPETNEIIVLDDYNCKILKRTDRSIELVKLTHIEEKEDVNE
ncbi:MAG: transporter associated domain-containing protein, partial [FCB group bacterium]